MGSFANIYNRDQALQKLGGDEELLREVEQVFTGDYPQMLLKMKLALENKEAINLQRLAHTMKGSVSPFCADRAYESALRLEMAAKDADWNAAPHALQELQNEIRHLVDEFTVH